MTTGKSARWILAVAGLFLAIATVLGALEAHVLPSMLSANALDIFDTGVRYHFYNSLGLLAIGITALNVESRLVYWAAGLLMAGIVLFSGSIYWLAFGAPTLIGFATPLGAHTVMTTVSLVRRHKVGDIADNEKISWPGRRDNCRINTRVATSDYERFRPLPSRCEFSIWRVVCGIILCAKFLKSLHDSRKFFFWHCYGSLMLKQLRIIPIA